ncbi:WD40 repeat protein [Malassezia japonica]|uniref:WD40 repeat protein n=1 Tax=Malassezia japonica TaxID=223818 RepID=A0AAF0J801_9BASI|nr:WD40 repeat protein [Malassezia japonica]WFD37182.1 WD40 repeat protein [Malassezia japonica]
MYWPYANAHRLSAAPGGAERGALQLAPSREGVLWLALTRTSLQVWSTRPCEFLAAVERTEHSLGEYGENVWAEWRHDTGAIAVRTARNMLLFYDLVGEGGYAYGAEQGTVPSPAAFHATFRAMTGEHFRPPHNVAVGAGVRIRLVFRHALTVEPGIASVTAYEAYLLLATKSPAAVQLVAWPGIEAASYPTLVLSEMDWIESDAPLTHAVYSRAMAMFVWIAGDYAYVAGSDGEGWIGSAFWSPEKGRAMPVTAAVNARFSLVALGDVDGHVTLFEFQTPDERPTEVLTLDVPTALHATDAYLATGPVASLAWTSDGHALLASYEKGWALWSTFGTLLFHSFRDDWDSSTRAFRDSFMFGIRSAFFGPGNTEAFVAAHDEEGEALAYAIPFVKSSSTAQMMPEEAAHALLQSDDSVFVYRGHELQDDSVLAPENDAWRHVSLPPAYLAAHWPIRYATLSSDARFVAVAGRRGLAHFSCQSGRWKTFVNPAQELSFSVRGGLVWFQHVLIAACDYDGEIQLRLYSRDADLANANLLDLIKLPSPVVLMSLFDTSLLVYTADNTLYHYLITPTAEHIRLRLCGSISFEGIVGEPARVRAMSWILPPSQQAMGDPAQDLTYASLLFLIDAKLVLLRPSRGEDGDVNLAYDLQILHEQTEAYWTNLQSRGPLHNSLWSYDGGSMSVWPDVLALALGETLAPSAVLPLDTYPICILLARGVVFGAEGTATIRKTLDTASFRQRSKTTPFLHALLRVYLMKQQLDEALDIAAPYRALTYFGHSLELLVHDLLEEEADARPPLAPSARRLPLILQFLDYFENALRVVVNVARKTEATRWPTLFDAAGRPQTLLRHCLDEGDCDTARLYLLIVHELEDSETSIALTAAVLDALERQQKWDALRELLSFLRSLDEDGAMLHASLRAAHTHLAPDSVLVTETRDAPPPPPKRALVAAPRRPTSRPERVEAHESSAVNPAVHTLHEAARHASLTLSPVALPVRHANGRIVMAPGASPRP